MFPWDRHLVSGVSVEHRSEWLISSKRVACFEPEGLFSKKKFSGHFPRRTDATIRVSDFGADGGMLAGLRVHQIA